MIDENTYNQTQSNCIKMHKILLKGLYLPHKHKLCVEKFAVEEPNFIFYLLKGSLNLVFDFTQP